MILDPFLLMVFLLIAAFGLMSLFLSPLVVELKKPKDNGPRRIPKTPIERRIRNAGRRSAVIGLRQTDYSNNCTDLQDASRKGEVKTTNISSEVLHISGTYVFSPLSVISKDVVVEGSLMISDDCVFHRSVKIKDDAFIGNRVIIKGNLVSEGDVTILDDVVIGGSLHSDGSVVIGEKVFVALSVVAVGNVALGENSEVKGGIFTRGTVKGTRHPIVELPSSIDGIE